MRWAAKNSSIVVARRERLRDSFLPLRKLGEWAVAHEAELQTLAHDQ